MNEDHARGSIREVMKRKRGGVGKRGALRTQNCDLRVRERLILNVCSECLSLLGASVKRVKRANQPLRPLFGHSRQKVE